MDVSSVALLSKANFLGASLPSPIVEYAFRRYCVGRAGGFIEELDAVGLAGDAALGEYRAAARVAAMFDGDLARGSARLFASGTSNQPGEVVTAEEGDGRPGVELPVN